MDAYAVLLNSRGWGRVGSDFGTKIKENLIQKIKENLVQKKTHNFALFKRKRMAKSTSASTTK